MTSSSFSSSFFFFFDFDFSSCLPDEKISFGGPSISSRSMRSLPNSLGYIDILSILPPTGTKLENVAKRSIARTWSQSKLTAAIRREISPTGTSSNRFCASDRFAASSSTTSSSSESEPDSSLLLSSNDSSDVDTIPSPRAGSNFTGTSSSSSSSSSLLLSSPSSSFSPFFSSFTLAFSSSSSSPSKVYNRLISSLPALRLIFRPHLSTEALRAKSLS